MRRAETGSRSQRWRAYFAVILREDLATGRPITGVAGGASSEPFDAADLVDFGAAWTTANLGEDWSHHHSVPDASFHGPAILLVGQSP